MPIGTTLGLARLAWVALALSLGANAMLLRGNHAVADDYKAYRLRNEVQPGDLVPALIGKDANGDPLKITYDGPPRRTLLVVFTQTCPHCKENWPNWVRLHSRARPERIRMVAVDMTGSPLPPGFVEETGIASVPIFTALDYKSGSGYKLRHVPTTMLIGEDGRLERIWTGVLNSDDMAFLEDIVD